MKKLILHLLTYLLLTGCTLQNSLLLPSQNHPIQKKITVLDERILIYRKKNNISFSEISDLAYDQKRHRLYMIGDKGNFYVFNAFFNRDKIDLDYLAALKISEKDHKDTYDSEGLTLDNRGQMFISFEKSPRISKISVNAVLANNIQLTKELKANSNYKSSNKIFEALAWHPRFGLLVAAEYPLHKKRNTQQTIYGLDGRKWNFTIQNYENNAVTAIEVMDDNNLLILERAYAGIRKPFVITLRKLFLNKCNKTNHCKSEVLTTFNSFEGWTVNNYEGLARVGKNRYVMISDNNNERFLATQLIYFKVN